MASTRDRWYADMLRAGLETQLFNEADVLAQATPSILVRSLPKDVMTRLLAAGMASGMVSPASMLQTATPDVMAAHVPHAVLWTCVATAAEKGGLTSGSGGQPIKDEASKREFLRRALESALATAVLTPKDVVGHVDPAVLIHHFPDDLNSKLLETSLAAGKIDPAMVVDVIGIPAMAKHAPPPVLWACVAQAGDKQPEAARPATPAAETKPPGAAETKPPATPRPEAKTVPERTIPPPAPLPDVKSSAPDVKPPSATADAKMSPAPPSAFDRFDTSVPIEVEDSDLTPAPGIEAEQTAARKSGLLSRLKRG